MLPLPLIFCSYLSFCCPSNHFHPLFRHFVWDFFAVCTIAYHYVRKKKKEILRFSIIYGVFFGVIVLTPPFPRTTPLLVILI